MSPRSEQRRQLPQPPGHGKTLLWGLIIGGLAVLAIVVYAVTQSSRVVPGAAVVSPQSLPSIPPPAKVGRPARPFSVQTRSGLLSSASLAGKPYMLELFATWCPHCQRMTAVLGKVRSTVPQSKFEMVSVTASPYGANSTPGNLQPESQADVDAFDAAYSVSWLSVFDAGLDAAKSWGLNGFPTIYIVNAKGTITYVTSGEVPEKTLLSEIKKAGG